MLTAQSMQSSSCSCQKNGSAESSTNAQAVVEELQKITRLLERLATKECCQTKVAASAGHLAHSLLDDPLTPTSEQRQRQPQEPQQVQQQQQQQRAACTNSFLLNPIGREREFSLTQGLGKNRDSRREGGFVESLRSDISEAAASAAAAAILKQVFDESAEEKIREGERELKPDLFARADPKYPPDAEWVYASISEHSQSSRPWFIDYQETVENVWPSPERGLTSWHPFSDLHEIGWPPRTSK